MRQVRTWLRNGEYERLLRQCEALEESVYVFVQTAIKERMERKKPLLKKIQDWLVEDHKILG